MAALWPGEYREAPALFKRDGVYVLITSGCSGWAPNQQRYATAITVAGPWSSLRDIGDATAYNSQTAYVLPVRGAAGTSYLCLGDRWAPHRGSPVNDSGYVWLTLDFDDFSESTGEWEMRMRWRPRVALPPLG